jgi:two-component system, OmpR family, sensor kinase
MKSLHSKFFLVMATLVLSVGALAFLVQEQTSQHYSLAMTQALNERLAERLAAEYLRSLPASADTTSAVKRVFSRIMAVNPNIDLYLLDNRGKILTYTAPPRAVVRPYVDLEPVKSFITQRFVVPTFGDDPRDLASKKIFSAASVDPARADSGYLYVVLGGAEYDAAARRLRSGLLFRSASTILGAGIAVALAAAFFVLMTMTRRLRLLAEAIDVFKRSDFRYPVPVHIGSRSQGDELDRLVRAYNAMIAHIRAQMEQIAESNALRRDLIAGVSHDLRTPLASLRGYLETLIMKDQALSAEDRRMYLEIASEQSDRLNRLVEELFELAKLEDREVRIDLEPFQLSELVQDVVQKFARVAQEKGIALAGRFTPEAPLVAGNIPLIERLLDNLLENAIRHTPAGGKIEVCVSLGRHGLNLEVSDTGTGIPEQDMPHVFERFYRVDRARSPTSGGAGLGLAIAKRIVELHRGSISVSSNVGVGTRFLVELPPRPQSP